MSRVHTCAIFSSSSSKLESWKVGEASSSFCTGGGGGGGDGEVERGNTGWRARGALSIEHRASVQSVLVHFLETWTGLDRSPVVAELYGEVGGGTRRENQRGRISCEF